MSGFIKAVLCVCVLSVAALAVTPRPAQAQGGCSITVQKDVLAPVDLNFTFAVDSSTDGQSEFSIPAGTHSNLFFVEGETDIVSEIVPEGWELIDVTCETEGGGFNVVVDGNKNVIAHCVSDGFSLCTFTNRGPANVPTLSEWGMIAAAAGFAMIGVFFAVRRRKVKAV
jgi:hypothetical protein